MNDKSPETKNTTKIEKSAERAGNFFHNIRNIIIGAAAIGAAGIAAQQYVFPTEAPTTYFYLAGVCEGTSRTPDNQWKHPMFVGEQIRIGGQDAPTDPDALHKALRKRLKGDLLELPATASSSVLGRNKPSLDGKQLVRLKPGECVRVDGVRVGKETSAVNGCPATGRASSYWARGAVEAC